MGQSSSVNSKSALPANNILIDASDSYVTDVKLRSTAVIPISEYIKRDKYNKNGQQRNQQIKKIDKNKETQKEDKSKVKNTNENHVELIEKKQFLESSYEDIPDQRKWVKSTKSITKQPLPPSKNPIPDKEKKYSSINDIHELYKNEVYPYIYKTKYKKNNETKQEEKKIIEPTGDSDVYLNKKNIKYHGRKQEMSTHTLNKHHYELNNQIIRKSRQSSFTIQTNVACIIHPEKKRYVYRICSDENIRKPHKQKWSMIHTTDYRPMNYDNVTSANDHQRVLRLEKNEEDQKKCLSARQALENWKNIHTLKQYHKQIKPEYYKEENTSKTPRSRAGYREIPKTEPQPETLSPLEISNYNYSKISRIHSSVYALHNKVGERVQKYKHNKKVERPHSSQFECVDNNSYKQNQKPNLCRNHHRYIYYGSPNRIDNNEEAILEREDFLADIERCLKNHHKRATIYGRQYSTSKSTWVQDKHRRWHKVIIE